MISLEEGIHIVREARRIGATLAGLTSVDALKQSASYARYHQSPYYDGYQGVMWPDEAKSVLVLALAHPEEEPGLDWWSEQIPGRTPGNRILMRTSRQLKEWLGSDHGSDCVDCSWTEGMRPWPSLFRRHAPTVLRPAMRHVRSKPFKQDTMK